VPGCTGSGDDARHSYAANCAVRYLATGPVSGSVRPRPARITQTAAAQPAPFAIADPASFMSTWSGNAATSLHDSARRLVRSRLMALLEPTMLGAFKEPLGDAAGPQRDTKNVEP
jgi:hypothetical protein